MMGQVLKKSRAPHADPDLQICLGAVIRRLRNQLGLTQEELAWRADSHRTYIADVERGARNLTLRVIANLAQALQIPLDRLFAAASASAATPRPNSKAKDGKGRVAIVRATKLSPLPPAARSRKVRSRSTPPNGPIN